ncbi:cytochrome o ubiquinol oxidase subunit IV [Sphingomonas sp.]|uniref:cytochrome o ubiquinol oxidase subunit IV n=1 Tax=Sphingomonas sp. TaxID=28214 RepID=UPI002CE16E31|nr:cytochrome o ubiquinol oxidase subunit IV [Sphingomonas sp.]HTG38146.1 cytochrome o ubiquinol oxidase subunit IV [Sphingomonas sp.]
MSAHAESHGEGGAAHATRGGYVTGFVLSVILTAIPFALVMGGFIADERVTAGIVMAMAVVQIVVHMIYFLHMSAKSENGWTLMALIFTAVIVVITIAGSLWVMVNMNRYMMPPMTPTSAQMDMSGM